MQRITTLISTIFEPLLVLALLTLLAGFHAQLTSVAFIQYFFILFLVMIGPIFVFRVWLVKKHGIDWDIRDRRKRIKPLAALCGFVILDMFLVNLLHNQILSQLFLLFAVWIIGFSLITVEWKISGHAGIAALATGMLVSWYGWHWWPVLLAVPLVAWARVVRKDHTRLQVIAGALYSWILVFLSHTFS